MKVMMKVVEMLIYKNVSEIIPSNSNTPNFLHIFFTHDFHFVEESLGWNYGVFSQYNCGRIVFSDPPLFLEK